MFLPCKLILTEEIYLLVLFSLISLSVFSFTFPFKCVPKHAGPCSEFYDMTVLEEIPKKQRLCSSSQNFKALVSRWRQILTCKIKMSSLNVLVSTNKVSIFKLTIKE